MRFKTHFIRRKSAPSLPPLTQPRSKAAISVSIYPATSHVTSTMSGRDSTISTSDASLDFRSGRDQHQRYTRRPNLAQILADNAPAPWTLEAFTAYAARNLCLENIEFIQDARRYKSHYYSFMGYQDSTSIRSDQRPGLRRINSAQVEKLRELWTRLIVTYIAPSSPKEINLTGDIRSGLLPHNKQMMPPPPELLEPAVKKIEELIEDSILFSFLNEVQTSHNPSIYQPSESREQLAIETGLPPSDKLGGAPAIQELLSPTSDVTSPQAFSPARRSPKQAHFNFSHVGRSSSFRSSNHKGSAVSATSATFPGSASNSIAPTLSEDSSSVVSPTASQGQRTPPRTPPANEPEHRRTSPKNHDRWKRMSQKFGFGRKSGTQLKDVAEDQPPLPDI